MAVTKNTVIVIQAIAIILLLLALFYLWSVVAA
jgi:hypothetical protein